MRGTKLFGSFDHFEGLLFQKRLQQAVVLAIYFVSSGGCAGERFAVCQYLLPWH